MSTQNQKSQTAGQSSTPSDTKQSNMGTSKDQTPGQKQNEKNLTEKDVNPSKEEKQIVQERGKGEQQTGNKAEADKTTDSAKPEEKEYKKNK